MNELFNTRQTWTHYIGGYYSDPATFIAEAQATKISRRAPANTVKGMQFGDRLVFLRYEGKTKVIAFAEAEIIGISLEHGIAQELGEAMAADGSAEFDPGPAGGTSVNRACGSYTIAGTWTVKISLAEVMDKAIEIAEKKGVKLFVMINARLTKAYDQPVILEPTPKFSRGFARAADQMSFSYDPQDQPNEGKVFGIAGYLKAPAAKQKRRAPKDQPLLLEEGEA